VFFELGTLVGALPAHAVRRLLLLDEVRAPSELHEGEWLLVEAAGRPHAGRDLGVLLEVPGDVSAWVLVDVLGPGGNVPLALRTGRCLMVDRLPPLFRVPEGLFRSRGRAFPAAFHVTGIASRGSASAMGLCVDPFALFGVQELGTAAGLLARADTATRERLRSAP
jgi:hypothetical protein